MSSIENTVVWSGQLRGRLDHLAEVTEALREARATYLRALANYQAQSARVHAFSDELVAHVLEADGEADPLVLVEPPPDTAVVVLEASRGINLPDPPRAEPTDQRRAV